MSSRTLYHVAPAGTRERLNAALGLCLVAAILLALWSRDPRTYGIGDLCPSKRFLGIYCPGCGGTRAIHDLTHLEWGRAFACNPLLVLVGTPTALWFGLGMGMVVFFGRRPSLTLPPAAWSIFTATVLAYWILRNFPSPDLECLRPPSGGE
ncbi:MAG: DUF2752 domain-containing protein [Planctomycetota bacterium]|nr:DUF2752 domain-containing protein [Planctomycetota bacterium]